MYGGTKSEMERLLADAEKLSGVHYDMDNLGDVYSAIHVIQEDLGLTGVAAQEASETFTGSFEAMKASATNLLADLTTGGDISDDLMVLGDTIFTFISGNLAPMVGNLLKSLPELLTSGIGMVIRGLNIVTNNADVFINEGIQLISELVNGILMQLPYLIESAVRLVVAFANALINADWVGIATNFINEFKENMGMAAGEIFGSDGTLLDALIDWITNTLPTVLENGIDIIFSLIDGILEGLPAFIDSLFEIINTFVTTIINNLPQIIETGIKLLLKLIEGIIKAIPKVVEAIFKIIENIIKTFTSINWKEVGLNILEGVKNGILAGIGNVVQAAKDAAGAIFDAVKDFFQIGSPSKLMAKEIGRWLPAGIAVGIEGNVSDVTRAMNDLTNATIEAPVVDINTKLAEPFESNSKRFFSSNRESNSMNPSSNSRLADMIADSVAFALNNMTLKSEITLDADDRRLFNVVQQQAKIYTNTTGQGAF